MTRQEIIAAVDKTLALARREGLDNCESDTPELDYPHLLTMRDSMASAAMTIDALNRWLGWIQAAVFAGANGSIGIDEITELNP